MNEIVERVAHHLAKLTQKFGLHPASADPVWWEEDARKIVALMRQPTADMIDAGAEVLYGHPREKAIEWAKEEKFEAWMPSAEQAFTAMIDQALKPDGG